MLLAFYSELFDNGLVLLSRGLEDIEVGQYLRAVDAFMKSCKPADDKIGLSKVQTDCGSNPPFLVTLLWTRPKRSPEL